MSYSAPPAPDSSPIGNDGLVCPKCRAKGPDSGSLVLCPLDGWAFVSAADFRRHPTDPAIGRVLAGRYALMARIGAGSMGTVYRAIQMPIGRSVALKLLRPDRIDPASQARFLREGRANSLLASPHTVTLYDFGETEDGGLFIAMELLEGESLGARLKREGRLPPLVALEIASQTLQSLAEAHAKGIVHRDLKPDNLFHARSHGPSGATIESVKVLDFGIAKMLHDDGPMSPVETQAGTVFGTPRYMSPEQAQGKPLDPRSDLYSLGVILYHMLVGAPPFTDDDAVLVMAHHIKTDPDPVSSACPEADFPKAVDDLVARALAKEPADRFSTAEDMLEAVAHAVEQTVASVTGVRSRRRGAVPMRRPIWLWAALGVFCVTVVTALALLASRPGRSTVAGATTTSHGSATQLLPGPVPIQVSAPGVSTVSVDSLPPVREAPGTHASERPPPRASASIATTSSAPARPSPTPSAGAASPRTTPTAAPTYERWE